MQKFANDDLLDRIMRYIQLSGASLTRDSTLTALKLVEELLVAESTDDFGQVLAETQRRFAGAELSPPLLFPEVNRGSIGYGDR